MIQYYVASIQEHSINNSARNGTHNAGGHVSGLVSEGLKNGMRASQSGVALFSRKQKGTNPEMIEAYMMLLGKASRYDHINGIQILSPRALQLALVSLEQDRSCAGDVSLFLDPNRREIIVRHVKDPRSVDRVADAGEAFKGLSCSNIVNRIESFKLGRADNSGRLVLAFGQAGGTGGTTDLSGDVQGWTKLDIDLSP